MMLPRLMFAAPKSGSGKTIATCGFLAAVKKRGKIPAAFKCGPDYIDPMFHRAVLGVPGGNLDSFFLKRKQLAEQLTETETVKADLAVIEGVMGYYDGLGGNSTAASSYEVACLTDTPVVLVVDAKGASVSLAATVKGFLEYRRDNRIRGVILNRLSPAMYGRMQGLFLELGIRLYGYLPQDPAFCLESRHLGLCLPGEVKELREKIGLLAEQMSRTVDIEGLLSLAEAAPGKTELRESSRPENPQPENPQPENPQPENPQPENLQPENLQPEKPPASSPQGARFQTHFSGRKKRVRLGVARDEAFCFYYQENLRLLERMGAELTEFSPLRDRELPSGICGLLLGGGYPEIYAKELSDNHGMLRAVRDFCRSEMPVLAECGGFLYLHRRLQGEDKATYPMASVIDAEGFRTDHLNRFGYISLEGPDGLAVKGHEFHYWESSDPGTCWKASKPSGSREYRCIHQNKGLIAGFPHLYYPSNPEFLERWLALAGERL